MYQFIARPYDFYDQDKKPAVLIREFLSPYEVAVRIAVLGAVAGFSPVIEIQTNCPIEAEEIWRLKYRGPLQKSLAELREHISFSVEAVQTVALNIFKTRHTTRPTSIYGNLMFKICKIHGVTDEEISKDPNENICMTFLRTLDNICSKHKSISDLMHYDDFGIYKQVDHQIDTLTDSSNRHIELSLWRKVCIDTLKAITNICSYDGWRVPAFRTREIYDVVLKEMLESVFSHELFPLKDIYQGSCNYSAVVKSLNYLRWIDIDEENIVEKDTVLSKLD